MKFYGKVELTRWFRDNGVCEIDGDVETQIELVVRLEVMEIGK